MNFQDDTLCNWFQLISTLYKGMKSLKTIIKSFSYLCTCRIKTTIMSTVIYPSPIFGPVHSRRLGVSLGINLLPEDGKFCTFDCIYCECGFNADFRPK